MNRRKLLAAGACTPLLCACYQPGQLFDLEWDEEVLLPDRSVVVVRMKHTYMRLEYSFRERPKLSGPQDSTLTLDAGTGVGYVTQLFKGFNPMFLGHKDGVWYAILIGGYRYKNREIPGQDWGDKQGPYGQWAIRLVSGKWQPMNLCDFPAEFKTPNMLLLYGNASELSKFHGKRVTLADKAAWLQQHPLGYADVRITKPMATTRYACATQQTQAPKETAK